jgi:diadenosine tetraphosphate (Ap4A) HIT family hydrolase
VSSCPFCSIVAGELEASVVHEDERTFAFLDIRPLTDGHALVVPRRHAASLGELDPEDGAAVFRAGQAVAAALRRSDLPCDGVNFLLADGAAAGQDVFHVHLHVVPRFEGDGFGLRFPPGYGVRPRAVLDAVAARVNRR